MAVRSSGAVWALLVVAASAARADDPVVTAARHREQAVRSIRVELHLREVVAPGALNGDPTVRPVPAAEVALESDNLLLIAGKRVRVEDAHPGLSGSGRPQARRLVLATDGAVTKLLFTGGTGPDASQIGSVRPPDRGEVGSPVWWPVLLTVRGLTPHMTHSPLTEYEAGRETEEIGGHRCRQYAGRSLARLWLDPESGFVPRQVTWGPVGGRTRRLDVRYRSDPAAGWLPTDWTLTETGRDGRVERTTTATVTAVRVNDPIPDDQFAVTFPPGAEVRDDLVGKEYRVEPDGTWAELSSGGPEPSEAHSPADVPVWRWVVGGIVVTAGLVGLVAVWRRGRRPGRGSGR